MSDLLEIPLLPGLQHLLPEKRHLMLYHEQYKEQLDILETTAIKPIQPHVVA